MLDMLLIYVLKVIESCSPAKKTWLMSGETPKPDDDEVRRAFGKVLRRLRERHAWTQDELAERTDSSQNYISHLEGGLKGPSLVRVFELARALGVSPGELVAEVNREVRKGVGIAEG